MSLIKRSSHYRKAKSRRTLLSWGKNSLKVSAVILLTTGIYLLVEQTDVSQNILNLLGAVVRLIDRILSAIGRWIVQRNTSDIISYILLLVASFLIVYRVRSWLFNYYLNTRSCPWCDSELKRIHKEFRHKLLGTMLRLRVKHYRCSNAECHWNGFQFATR